MFKNNNLWLLRLYPRRANHLAPFGVLGFYDLREVGGRAADGFNPGGEEFVFHLGIGDHAGNFAAQALDQWRWRFCAHQHACEKCGFEAGQSR